MDDGGNKSEFELEVNDKDVELVSADIESPGEDDIELPVDDTELTEGDISEPVDPEEEPKKPEDKPADEEKPADEPSEDELDAELDSELDALEAEEKEEEAPAEEEKAEEVSEETTSADEEKPEEEPAEEEKAEEEPTEEEKAENEPADEPTEDETTEEAPVEDAPADEEPAEEEKPEEETPAEEPEVAAEEEKAEDEPEAEEPAEEEKPEEAPIVVEGENAPVDSTAANSTFPVEPAKETKDNKSKIGLFVMIAIIVLLLIGCGIFALMGGGKPAKNNNNNSKTEQPTENDGKLARELDIKLLKALTNGSNSVYSPLSIKYALSLLEEGTDGSTLKELTDLIGENYTPRKYTNNDHMVIANAIFVRDDFKNQMKQAYLDSVKEKYNASTIYDEFNNASTLNDWVYTNTLKLIPEILDDSDVTDLVFILANTVAIDMNWVNNFQCSFGEGGVPLNKCMEYHVGYAHEKASGESYEYSDFVPPYDSEHPQSYRFNNAKEVSSVEIAASLNNYDIISELGEDNIRKTVKEAYEEWKKTANEYELKEIGDIDKYLDDYIQDISKNYKKVAYSTDFRLYNDDSVKVFAKDLKEYDGTQLEYVAIMPKIADLSAFANGMTVEKIDEYIGKLKEIKNENFDQGKIIKITGYVPLFDYNLTFDLQKVLEKLGVKEAFDPNGNLTKITDSKDVHISKAIHSAKIEFSNEGIKAAGATVLGGAGNAGEPFDYLFEVPIEIIDMTFDKPFMYIIRDKANGEVWFMGTVYEPMAKK